MKEKALMKKLERRLVTAMLSMCGIVLLTSCGTGKTASEESGESSVKTVQQQAGESDATQTTRPVEPTPTPVLPSETPEPTDEGN